MLSAPIPTSGAVFLSYAREDAAAARRIADALRAFGVEVWFDQHELRGGDQWDARIRQQVRECRLFIPIISATTESRAEGYFRREWKLAAERTHDMGKRAAFLVPVVIDATAENGADVPDEFLRVQWTRLPNGVPSPSFVEQVKRLLVPRPEATSEAFSSASNDEPRRPVPIATARPAAPRRVALAALVLAALVGTGVVVWKLRPRSSTDIHAPRPAITNAAEPLDKAVAVLPFANLSGDPAQEYFSDGITEEILDALARERDLRVPGRASAFAFKSRSATNADIARALNVGQLVEGSVRRAGNQVRISVSLWRASDGRAEPLEPVEGEMTGTKIFALQEAVARAVVQRLTRRTTTAAAPLPTSNMEAYDLFLRARTLRMRSSAPGIYEAMNKFEQVVRLDPNFAAAWAELADVAASLGNAAGGFDMSEETRRRAVFAAARAVELGPDLAETHVARATVFLTIDTDPDAAERELMAVERLQPQSADLARMRALVVAARNPASTRLLELANRAVALDPENPRTLLNMGLMLNRNGQFARADELFRRSTAIGQGQTAYHAGARNWIAWTGDLAEGIRRAGECPESYRNEIFYRTLAPWHEQRGEWTKAKAVWEKSLALARAELQRPGIRTATAMILTELGAHAARAGDAAAAQKHFAEACSMLEAVGREQPESSFMHLRWVRWHQARQDWPAARTALAAAETLSRGARQKENVEQAKAALLAASGAPEEAIAVLRAAHERGWAFGYSLRHEVELKPLHGRPAFEQLMREAEARANAIPRPKR